jgi:hypothetical protein
MAASLVMPEGDEDKDVVQHYAVATAVDDVNGERAPQNPAKALVLPIILCLLLVLILFAAGIFNGEEALDLPAPESVECTGGDLELALAEMDPRTEVFRCSGAEGTIPTEIGRFTALTYLE